MNKDLPLKACQKAFLSSAPVSACYRSMVNSTSLLLPLRNLLVIQLAYGNQRAQKKTKVICAKERSCRSRKKSLINKSKAKGVSGKKASGRSSEARAINKLKTSLEMPQRSPTAKAKGAGGSPPTKDWETKTHIPGRQSRKISTMEGLL
ncbi:hypothetical protein VNO80_30643 [Phaseolus coccineus]|uniref:Uncharacterized protein n=1 Tax=Phaseolus coccineus TaxID=3886 RepID=A0AAN9LI71_PHACN